MKPSVNQVLSSVAMTLAISQGAGAATTITMDAGGSARLNGGSFGSNIPAVAPDGNFSTAAGAIGTVGTPDIALAWGGNNFWDQYNNWDGRGTVIQAETYDNTQTLTLSFTPTISTAVVLNRVDFDEWSGGGNLSITWSVVGASSGTLASGVWTRSTGGRDNMDLNSTGVLGEVLTLSLTNTDGVGSGSYFAIDNLTFDQVPEPSGIMIGALGLGAAAMRRRRR